MRNLTNKFINGPIFKSYKLLSRKERKKLNFLIIASFFAGIVDILSIFSVIPFVGVLIEPSLINSNKYLNYLYLFLGYPKIEFFLLTISIFAILIVLIGSCINIYSQLEANRFAAKSQERLGNEMMKMMLYAPYEWHLKYNPTILVTLFNEHAGIWNKNIIRQLPLLAGRLAAISVPFLGLFLISPIIAMTSMLTIVPFLLFFLRRIKLKTSKLLFQRKAAGEKITIFCTESLQGIKDVKLSSNHQIFLKFFSQIYHTNCMSVSSSTNWNILPTSLILTAGQLFIILIGVCIFFAGIRGGELASIMAIVILIASKIIPSINKIGTSIIGIVNVQSWIDTLYEINLDLQMNYSLEKGFNIKKKLNWNKIELKEIYFSYPKNKIATLKNINLTIERGKHYGLVGPSGSGKSTTVDICLGLIKASKGEITIDDNHFTEINLKKWQSLISYVPQNPLISESSLRENVAFGINKNDIDDKKVNQCLEMANISDLTNLLPDGIYSNLGDRGRRLSGGQKQRVAIARALYKNPDILVLDEATSSMDLINEENIKNILKNLRNKITVISISHNLSTIKNSDEVFLFDNGSIIDRGTFNFLYKNNKLFRRLTKDEI